MQNIFEKINKSAKYISGDEISVSALYDKYAPALYGTILRVVKEKDIAEKLLQRVFIDALKHKNLEQPAHIKLFTVLLNHSRKKTYGTLKALKVIQACSCGFVNNLVYAG